MCCVHARVSNRIIKLSFVFPCVHMCVSVRDRLLCSILICDSLSFGQCYSLRVQVRGRPACVCVRCVHVGGVCVFVWRCVDVCVCMCAFVFMCVSVC